MASEVETHQSLVTHDNISLAKEKEEQTPDVSTNVTQKEEKQTDDGSSEEKVDSEQASAGEMNIRKTTGSENSSDEKLIEEDLSFRGGGTREKTAVILEPEKSEQIEKLRNSNEIEPVKTYDCDIQNLRISDDEKKDISSEEASEAVCDSTQICAGRTTAYLQELCHKINEPNVSPADNDQKVEDNMKGEYLTHKEGNNESVLLKEDQNELTTLEEENNAENRQNTIEGSTSELGLDRKGEISETRDKELDNNQINVGERQITCIPVQSSVDEAAQHLKDGSEKEFIKEITELDTTSLDTTEVAIIPLNLSLGNISDSYVGKNEGDSQNYPAEEPQIEVNKAEVHSTVKAEGIGEILPQLKIKDETVTLSEDNPSQGLQTENTAGSEVVSPRNLRMKTDEQEVNLKYAEISESKNIYAVEEEVQFSSLQYSSEPQYFEEPISDPSQMLSREISGSRVNEAMQKETSNEKVAYVDQSSEPDRQKTNNESFQVDVEVSVMLVKDKEFHSHQTQAGEKEMNSEKELDSNGKQSAKLDEDVEQHTASSTDTTASDLNNKSYAATSEATEQSTDKETMEKKFYMMQETGNKDEAILREILSGNMPKQVTNELQGKQIDMLMPEGHRTVDETPFIEYSREYVSEQVDNQLHVLKAVAGFVTDKESTEETNSDDMHATHLRSQNISESGITRIQNETKAAQLCGSFETEEADIVNQIYTVDTRTDGVNSDHGDKNEETLMDVEAVVQNVDAKDATDRIVHSTNLSNEKTQLEQRMKEATIQEENCDRSNLEPDCMRVAASPKENIQVDSVEKAATWKSSTISVTNQNSKVVDFTDRETAREGHGEHLSLRVVEEDILPEAEDSSNKTDDTDQATKDLEQNDHTQIIKEINEIDCEQVIQGESADEDSTKIQFPILLVTDMIDTAINQEQQAVNVEPLPLTVSAITKSDNTKDKNEEKEPGKNEFKETDGTTSVEKKEKAKQRSQEEHCRSEKLDKEISEVSAENSDDTDANIGQDKGERIFSEQMQVMELQEEAVTDEQQHCPVVEDSQVHNHGDTLEENIEEDSQIEKEKSYSVKVENDNNAMNDTSSMDFKDHEADFAENQKENKKIREMETPSCVKNIDMYHKEKFENVDQEKPQLKEECQSTPTECKLEHCRKTLPEETADNKVLTLGSTEAPQLSTEENTCTYDEQIYGNKEADGLCESSDIDGKELCTEKVSLNQELKLNSGINSANEGVFTDTGVSVETQETWESNTIDDKGFPTERGILNQGFEVQHSSQGAPKGASIDIETFDETNELYETNEIDGKELSTEKEILNQGFKVDGSSISASNEGASTQVEQSGATHELCKSSDMDGKEIYTRKEILNKVLEQENCNEDAPNEGASTDVEASGETHKSCEYKSTEGKSFSTETETLHQRFEVDNSSQSAPEEASTDTETFGQTNELYEANEIDGKEFSTEKKILNQGFKADDSSKSAPNEGASTHVGQSGGTHELYKSNDMDGKEHDSHKEILDEGFEEDNCNESAPNEEASTDIEASEETHESCEYKGTDGKSFSTEKEILHQGSEVDSISQSAPNQRASALIEASVENRGAEKVNKDQNVSAEMCQGGNTVSEENKEAAGAENDKLYCEDTKNRMSKVEGKHESKHMKEDWNDLKPIEEEYNDEIKQNITEGSTSDQGPDRQEGKKSEATDVELDNSKMNVGESQTTCISPQSFVDEAAQHLKDEIEKQSTKEIEELDKTSLGTTEIATTTANLSLGNISDSYFDKSEGDSQNYPAEEPQIEENTAEVHSAVEAEEIDEILPQYKIKDETAAHSEDNASQGVRTENMAGSEVVSPRKLQMETDKKEVHLNYAETGSKDEAILKEIPLDNLPKQVTDKSYMLQGKQIDMLKPEEHITTDETHFFEYSREHVSDQVDDKIHDLREAAGGVISKESTEEKNCNDMHTTYLQSQNISESGITGNKNETNSAQLCGSFETDEADIVKQIYTLDIRTGRDNSDHTDHNEENLMDVEAVLQNVDAKDAIERIDCFSNISNDETQLGQRMKEAIIEEENCDRSNLEPDDERAAASLKENIQVHSVEKAAACESSTSAEAEICGTDKNSKVVDFTDSEIAEEIQEGHGKHLGHRVIGEAILPEAEDSCNKTDSTDQATKNLEQNDYTQIIKEINKKDCDRVIQGERADEDSTKIQFPILLVTDMTSIAINQEEQDVDVEPTIQLTGSAVTKSDNIKDKKDEEGTEQYVFNKTDGTTSTEEKAKTKQRSQERHYESEKLEKEITEVSIADTDVNDANIGQDTGETIFSEQLQVIEHQEEAVTDTQQHCTEVGDSHVQNDGDRLEENIQLDPVEKAATCESSTSAEAEICVTAENSKVVDFTDREIAEEIQEGHGEHLGLRVVGEDILPEAEDSSNKTDDIDQATKVLEHSNHAQIIKEINEKDCERVIQEDRADEDSTKIQFPILLVTDMTEVAINQEQQDLNVEPTIQLTGSAVSKSDSIKDEKDGERTEQNVFTETDGTTSTEEKAKAKQRSQERHYESEKLNKEIIEVSIADTDVNDANIGEDRGETIFGEQVQVIEHQEEAVIDEQQHCPQIGDSRVHNDGGTLEEESIVVSAQIEKDKSYSIKVEEDKNAMNDTSSIDFHDHEADFAENLKENKKIREMETLSCVKNIDMYDKEKFENVDESQEKLQLKEECQSTPTERKLEHCPKLLPEETADHKVITLGSTKAPQLSTQVNTCTYDEQIYGDKEADGLRESNEIDTKELRIEKVSLNQEFKLNSDSNCAPNEGAINDTGVSGETQEPRESNKIDGKEFPKEREIVNQGFEVHNSSQSAPKGDSTDTETFGDTNELYEITEINGKEFSTKKEILNQVFKVDGSSISAPNERASTHIEQSGGTPELCKSHEMDGKELYAPKEILNKGFEEENCNQSALNEGASTDVEASGETHESCEYKGADGKSFSTEKEILHQGFEVDNRSQSTQKEASTDTKTFGKTNDLYKTNQIDGKVFSTEKEIHNQGFNADGSSRSAANEGASPHVEQSGGTHELYKSNEMNGEELDTRKEILDEGFVEDNCNKSALNEGASIDVEASAETHESCEYKATDGKSFSTEKEILHQGFEVDIGSPSAPNQVASVHIEAPAENKGAEKANQDQDKSAQVRQGGNTVSEEKKTAAGAEHDKLYCKDTKNRISKEEVIPETASTSKSEMALVFAEIKDDELVAHIAEQMSGECTAAQQNKPLDTDCGNPKRNEGTDRTIDLDEQKPIVRSMQMKENETSSQEGLLQSNTIDDVGVRMIEDMQSKDDKKDPPLKFQDLNQTASQEDGINRQPTLVVESGNAASTVIRATQFAEELVLGHSEKEVTSSDDIASFTNCQKVDDSIPYVTDKILVEQTKETEDKLWPASFASEATVTINDNAKNTTIQHILKEEKLEDFSFEKPTQEPGLSEQTQRHLMHSNFEPTKEPEIEEVTKIDDASVQRASDLSSDSQDDKDPLDVKASGDSERYSDICSQETKSEQTTDGVDHDSITKSISVEIGEPCKGVINIQGQIETPEHYKEQTTTEDDKIMSHKVEYPELTVEEKKYSDNHEPHRVTEPNTTEENQETSTENSPVDGEAHDPTASYGIEDTIIVKNEELDNQSLQNRDYGNENQSILENIQAKSCVRDEDNLTTNSADEFQVTEKKETAGVEKIQADTQIARTKDVAPIKELSYGDHIVVQHSLQPANSCDESEKFVMVDKTTMEPDPSGGKELDSTDTQRMFGEEQKPQETYDATYSNRQLESPIIGESKEKNQVDVNVQESKSTIGTKEKEGSSLPSVDPVIDSMDIKEKERTADKTQEIERKSVPTDSTKIYSLDLKQESTVQPLSFMGSKSEEGEQGTRKDKTQDGEEPTSVEQNTDEEKEEKEDKGERSLADSEDVMMISEPLTEMELKASHKKSHNILSGVGSKVKHSISKVKQAMACTSRQYSPEDVIIKLNKNKV